MPELPAEPTDIEPPPRNADKLELMSRNCTELKKSLAQLQSQMNTLSAEKEKPTVVVAAPPSVAAAPVAPKKSNKNKKNKTNKTTPAAMDSKDRAIHKEMVATIKSVGGAVVAAAEGAAATPTAEVTEVENGGAAIEESNGNVAAEATAAVEVLDEINLNETNDANVNEDATEPFECIDAAEVTQMLENTSISVAAE